jgi:SUF system FeS cluster assembly, SufBD
MSQLVGGSSAVVSCTLCYLWSPWSTQVETGSAITWKYPSCILKGDGSVGEFYSVALTNNAQQADTGRQRFSAVVGCFWPMIL